MWISSTYEEAKIICQSLKTENLVWQCLISSWYRPSVGSFSCTSFKSITYFHWKILVLARIWTQDLPSTKPICYQLSYPGLDWVHMSHSLIFYFLFFVDHWIANHFESVADYDLMWAWVSKNFEETSSAKNGKRSFVFYRQSKIFRNHQNGVTKRKNIHTL